MFTLFFLDGYVNLFQMLKRPGESPNTPGSKFLLHLTIYTFPTCLMMMIMSVLIFGDLIIQSFYSFGNTEAGKEAAL